MKRIILLVTVPLLMVAFAGMAQAQPAEQSPIGGLTSHTHHVITGNGECVEIDSVPFERDNRGLHQGGLQSGINQGPEHSTCPAR